MSEIDAKRWGIAVTPMTDHAGKVFMLKTRAFGEPPADRLGFFTQKTMQVRGQVDRGNGVGQQFEISEQVELRICDGVAPHELEQASAIEAEVAAMEMPKIQAQFEARAKQKIAETLGAGPGVVAPNRPGGILVPAGFVGQKRSAKAS